MYKKAEYIVVFLFQRMNNLHTTIRMIRYKEMDLKLLPSLITHASADKCFPWEILLGIRSEQIEGSLTKQAVLLPRPSNFLLHLPKPYSLTKLEQEQSKGKYNGKYIENQFFITNPIISILFKLLTTYGIGLTYCFLTIFSILIRRTIAGSIAFRIIASSAIQTSEIE